MAGPKDLSNISRTIQRSASQYAAYRAGKKPPTPTAPRPKGPAKVAGTPTFGSSPEHRANAIRLMGSTPGLSHAAALRATAPRPSPSRTGSMLAIPGAIAKVTAASKPKTTTTRKSKR